MRARDGLLMLALLIPACGNPRDSIPAVEERAVYFPASEVPSLNREIIRSRWPAVGPDSAATVELIMGVVARGDTMFVRLNEFEHTTPFVPLVRRRAGSFEQDYLCGQTVAGSVRGRLMGRALDSNPPGRPVPLAKSLVYLSWPSTPVPLRNLLRQTAGPDGGFSFEAVPSGVRLELTVNDVRFPDGLGYAFQQRLSDDVFKTCYDGTKEPIPFGKPN